MQDFWFISFLEENEECEEDEEECEEGDERNNNNLTFFFFFSLSWDFFSSVCFVCNFYCICMETRDSFFALLSILIAIKSTSDFFVGFIFCLFQIILNIMNQNT